MLALLLALALSPFAHAADGSLLVQFREFKGEGCAYRKSLAALYVDRYFVTPQRESVETAWKRVDADGLNDGQPVRFSLKDLPDNPEKTRVTFRFYALHNQHSADHYESKLRLTKAFAASLQPGQPVRQELEMLPTFEEQKGRKCKLVLEFTKILPPAPPAPEERGGNEEGGSSPAL